MVRLALGSAKRPMVSSTGGVTSPAGHHRDLNFHFFWPFFQPSFHGSTVRPPFDLDVKYGGDENEFMKTDDDNELDERLS